MTVILTTCVHSVGGVAGGLPCGVCEQNKMLQTRYLREMQADGSSRVRDLYSPESGVTEPDQTDLEISMLKEQQDALGLKLMEVEVEKVELKALTKKATQDLATAEGLLREAERHHQGRTSEIGRKLRAFLNRDAPKPYGLGKRMTLEAVTSTLAESVIVPMDAQDWARVNFDEFVDFEPKPEKCKTCGGDNYVTSHFKPTLRPCPDCTKIKVKP